MKASSPSSNGKAKTDLNNNNTPSRSSELVRYIPVKNNTSNTISYNRPPKKVLASSLVRLGEERWTNRKEHRSWDMKYIQRNIDSNYTQMNNHSAQNAELSLQAKGLLWVLMTNREDWRPYIEELSKRSKSGRDAHRTAFNELKKAGYIRIYRKSLGRGQGVQTYPLVQDIPITDSYWSYWVSRIEKELSTEVVDN